MKSPSISLIVAVYKRPDALEKIFCSLQRQVFTDFEVVVADDGSPSAIADCIASWQTRVQFPIKHVWHEDVGFRKTIIANRAVCEAGGEYLVFIDGDCILHHRFLDDHWRRKEKGAVLAGRRVMMNAKAASCCTLDTITTGSFEAPLQWLIGSEKHTAQYAFRIPFLDPIRNRRRSDFFTLGSNFSLYRSDFFSVNGYDERIIGRGMEDDNLHARFCAAGGTSVSSLSFV